MPLELLMAEDSVAKTSDLKSVPDTTDQMQNLLLFGGSDESAEELLRKWQMKHFKPEIRAPVTASHYEACTPV